MITRNFSAELQAARAVEDWDACSRIWEERRLAEVYSDEEWLEQASPCDPCDSEEAAALYRMENPTPYSEYDPEAFAEMVEQDLYA